MELNINSPAYYSREFSIDDEVYWFCRENMIMAGVLRAVKRAAGRGKFDAVQFETDMKAYYEMHPDTYPERL